MHNEIPLVVAAILGAGVLAQWIGWRLRIPAIVFLLGMGLIAGPITGWLHPDKTFGDVLLPVVSLSVAVILFEGSMGLGISGVRSAGRAVWSLLTIGAAVTLALTTTLCYFLLGLDLRVSMLIASILVVTGPTVIGPIVRTIGLRGRVAALLESEGTLIDPIGAIITLLVFQFAIENRDASNLFGQVAWTFGIGIGIGVAAALILTLLLARFIVPDQMHQLLTLALVLGAFSVSNQLSAESGLIAVTAAGITLASQRRVEVRHVLEFNETLRLLFISGLFILLAARIERDSLTRLEWKNLLLLALLIVVVRPLSVFAATWITALTRNEKIFLSLTAPRGIVAASVASIFSLRLEELGVDGSQEIISVTFTVIVGTVLLSGFASRPIASRLRLIETAGRRKLVVLGAGPFARALAGALEQHEVAVQLVDLDRRRLATARMAGLGVHSGSLFADDAWEQLGLDKAAAFLATTRNDELNALAARHTAAWMGKKSVFQVAPRRSAKSSRWRAPSGMFARLVFDAKITIDELDQRVEAGWLVKATHLTDQFPPSEWRQHNPDAVVLGFFDRRDQFDLYAVDSDRRMRIGDTIVALAPPNGKKGPRNGCSSKTGVDAAIDVPSNASTSDSAAGARVSRAADTTGPSTGAPTGTDGPARSPIEV